MDKGGAFGDYLYLLFKCFRSAPMIQPQSLEDGPQANLPPTNLDDYQGLLNDGGSDFIMDAFIDQAVEESMFSAEEVMIAIAEEQAKFADEVADEVGTESGASFDASPDAELCQTTDVTENLKQLPANTMVGASDKVSRKALVNLLEGFVDVLKSESEPDEEGRQYRVELVSSVKPIEAHVDDRTQEIENLRSLVIEAQDTIIKLLTDRVEDRAKIATLETQVALLPDLQAQADRAMAAAVKTEEYRTELTKIKFEVDRFKLFRVRSEEGSLWARIKRWFVKPSSNQ